MNTEDFLPSNSSPSSIMMTTYRRKIIRNQYEKNFYVRTLHELFSRATPNHSDEITLEQWMASGLRPYIGDGKLNDEDFKKFFFRMDANNNGMISWEEFTDYLITDMTVKEFHIGSDAIQFIQQTGHYQGEGHRCPCLQISISPHTNEYITLSSDSIRFWNANTLESTKCILDPGLFHAFIIFKNYPKMAVITLERRLLLYDIESLQQLPFSISASPSPQSIKEMSAKQAIITAKTLSNRSLPLYDVPTTIALGDVTETDQHKTIFFIGDDQGHIQIFELSAPQLRQSTDFQAIRLLRFSFHKGAITQIQTITTLSCYASSSEDGTVKMWIYFRKENQVHKVREFKTNEPVSTFYYSDAQRFLVTCGVSRDATVWSITPPKIVSHLSGHYNQVIKITNYVTSNGTKYILTMTNRKEFRLWDAINYRFVREWSEPETLFPENIFSCLTYDSSRHGIIAVSGGPIRYSENLDLLETFFEATTHRFPIVVTAFSKPFEQLVTVDSSRDIKLWNISNGHLEGECLHPKLPGDPVLCVATLDPGGRRLLTATFCDVTKLSTSIQAPKTKNDFYQRVEADFRNRRHKQYSPVIHSPKQSKRPSTSMSPIVSKPPVNFKEEEFSKLDMWNFNSGEHICKVILSPQIGVVSVLKYVHIDGKDYLARGGWNGSFALFVEISVGFFLLYREFQGMKDDVTSVTSFPHGVVVGLSSGEIYTFVTDNNRPQSYVKLNYKAVIECLESIDNLLIAGDSIGNIHIYSYPKLIEIQSIFAHGITKKHSISSLFILPFSPDLLSQNDHYTQQQFKNPAHEEIPSQKSFFLQAPHKSVTFISPQKSNLHEISASLLDLHSSNIQSSLKETVFNDQIDEPKYVLFTGDTLGHVKKWLVSERGYLTPGRIIRCSYDEISQLFITEKYCKFLVTQSADMCVRLWRASDLTYIGLFCGKKSDKVKTIKSADKTIISDRYEWNLIDSNKYDTTICPFPIDPKSFISIGKSISMKNNSFTPFTIDSSRTNISISGNEGLSEKFSKENIQNNETSLPPRENDLSIFDNDYSNIDSRNQNALFDFDACAKCLLEISDFQEGSYKVEKTKTGTYKKGTITPQLGTSSYPDDLIHKMNNLLKKNPSPKKVTQNKINLPISVPKSVKKMRVSLLDVKT